MNPIPLLHDGVIRAWMCGHCYHVNHADFGHRIPTDEALERSLGFAKNSAERCCSCRDCGVLLEKTDDYSGMCDRCRWFSAWSNLARKIAEAMAVAALPPPPPTRKARPAPIVPIPDYYEEPLYRRELAWHLLGAMSEHSEDVFCAGWMSGLEYSLWEIGTSAGAASEPDEIRYSSGWYSAPLCRRLVALAELIDVWWTWRSPIRNAVETDPIREQPGVEHGPWPVTLETWRRMRAVRECMHRARAS